MTSGVNQPDVPIFMIAGSAYLVALMVIHLLAPKLEPANLAAETPAKSIV